VPVLLAHAIEDFTDNFGISGGGLNPTPLGMPLVMWQSSQTVQLLLKKALLLALRSRKGYSYTSTPLLVLHSLFLGELYLYQCIG